MGWQRFDKECYIYRLRPKDGEGNVLQEVLRNPVTGPVQSPVLAPLWGVPA